MSTRFPGARSSGASILLSGLLLGAVFASPAQAGETVYRCVVNGKTTYTDKPCQPNSPTTAEPSVPKTPEKTITLDYTTPYGTWRGQAQYQGTVKGRPVQEAHVVVPLVIDVEQQGKVTGTSPENGCKLLGVAAPYVASSMLSLDVTLSGCRYPDLNRRYSGLLILSQERNSVQLSLRSSNEMVAVLLKGPAEFDIKATMRR